MVDVVFSSSHVVFCAVSDAFITYSIFPFVLNYFIQILFSKGASEIPSFDNDKRC